MAVTWHRDAREFTLSIVLAALVLEAQGPGIHSILPLYLAAVTPALLHSDLTERRLPHRLVIPGYFVAGAALVTGWLVAEPLPAFSVVGAVGYFAFLLALTAAGGMGMGDVKLAGVLGFAAGSLGIGCALASPVIAFVVGSIAALVVVAQHRGRTIPFGPCMLAGFWSAAVFF